jgi:ankyrin repeat protein
VDPFWQDAIERGDVDAIRELVARDADVDALDRYGQTGLMLAARAGRADLVAALIEHGADLDVTAKFGLSAIMLAVVNRHAEVARLLIRAGCDRTLRGSGAPGFAGKTARDLAEEQGLHGLAAELE